MAASASAQLKLNALMAGQPWSCWPVSPLSWPVPQVVSVLCQLQGLKLMVRWLLGLKSNSGNSGTSTLRLLNTLILHDGDLMERGAIKWVTQSA